MKVTSDPPLACFGGGGGGGGGGDMIDLLCTATTILPALVHTWTGMLTSHETHEKGILEDYTSETS